MELEQKQIYKLNNRKRTFDEYKNTMHEHLRNINAELSAMFQDLADGMDEHQTAEIDGVIKDFSCNQINELSEKLKDCFY